MTKESNLALALNTTNTYDVRANATLKLNPIEHADMLRKLSCDESPHVRRSAIHVMDTKLERAWIEQTYAQDSDYDVRLTARRKLAKIGVILEKEPVPM